MYKAIQNLQSISKSISEFIYDENNTCVKRQRKNDIYSFENLFTHIIIYLMFGYFYK